MISLKINSLIKYSLDKSSIIILIEKSDYFSKKEV